MLNTLYAPAIQMCVCVWYMLTWIRAILPLEKEVKIEKLKTINLYNTHWT